MCENKDIPAANRKIPNVIHETSFDFVDTDDMASFCSDQRHWTNKMRKLAEQYPDECRIVADNPDGYVVLHCPKSWFRISRPKQRVMTNEQRAELAERMRKVRNCVGKIADEFDKNDETDDVE